MKISNIELINYRNYEHALINFSDGLNIIEGKNAQGKTNLVEAVYFCAVGKSFKTSKEKDIINWAKDLAKIKITIQKEIGQKTIEFIFSKNAKKTIKIDGIPIKKIGELMGELNAVFFAPDELKLIKDSPEDRRRFMDVSLSQTYKDYFYTLSNYNKILQSRNKALKTYNDPQSLKQILNIYNLQMAESMLKIKKYRKRFVEKLNPYADMVHGYLTNKKESLSLEYQGIEQDQKEKIIEKLNECFEKDSKLGYTTFGCHRDDIKVCVNNVDVRAFGSQGQQRTSALSMKLAELEIIKQDTSKVPILILDDVLSELDQERKQRLLKFCSKAQTLLTCTDFNFDIEHNKIIIKNGNVEN